MTAKEYLKQYENAVKMVARVQREYNEQLEEIDNIRSSLDGDGLPHGGEISRKVENQAIKLAEKAEELMDAEIYSVRIRQQIFSRLLEVPGEVGDVLVERYINLRTWEDVADQVGYSVRHVHNLHKVGLEKVEKILGLHKIA